MTEKLMTTGFLFLTGAALAQAHSPETMHYRAAAPSGETACRDYRPGQSMTQKDYDAYYNGLMRAFRGEHPDRIPKIIADWNSALDREATPALYEVFHNPATKVFFGAFTDPDTRVSKDTVDGEPAPNSRDRGQGLRVVWQSEISGRLISVITFWRFNLATGEPELINGRDALRVRVQIGDYVHRPNDRNPGPNSGIADPGVGFAAVSYTTRGDSASIRSLEPTVPIPPGQEGSDPARHPRIAGATAPWACAACHRGNRNRLDGVVDEPALPSASLQAFLDDAEGKGVPPDKIQALRERLASPEKRRETFLPRGLLAVINRKCRELK